MICARSAVAKQPGASAAHGNWRLRARHAGWPIDPGTADLFEPRAQADRVDQRAYAGVRSGQRDDPADPPGDGACSRLNCRKNSAGAGQGATAPGAAPWIAFSGWLVLLAAAVLGLATVVPAWLAALIVALLVLATAGALAHIGESPGSARTR